MYAYVVAALLVGVALGYAWHVASDNYRERAQIVYLDSQP
jgi:hypothetical protein